jgi:beta-lactam-binding protein with PASTA domain
VQFEPPTDPLDTWPTPEHRTVATRDAGMAPPVASPPPDRRIGQGMLLALGVLVLVAIGIGIAYLFTHRSSTPPTTTVVVTSSGTPAGQVRVIVPNVSGLPEAQARSGLQAMGLTVNAVTVPSAQPPGTVVAESPAGGAKVAKGSAVRINLSSGTSTVTSATTTGATATGATTTTSVPPQPTTATVPDLTTSQLQAAVQQLEAAGLLASIQYIPGDDPLGTIEHQSPIGGGTVKARSHVTINASSGPGDKPQEAVPDATGQTLSQAVSTMNGAQLRLIFVKVPVSSRSQAGRVVAQTPAAAKQAPENAQILVFLGAFKPR